MCVWYVLHTFRRVIGKENFPIRLLENFLPIPIISDTISYTILVKLTVMQHVILSACSPPMLVKFAKFNLPVVVFSCQAHQATPGLSFRDDHYCRWSRERKMTADWNTLRILASHLVPSSSLWSMFGPGMQAWLSDRGGLHMLVSQVIHRHLGE